MVVEQRLKEWCKNRQRRRKKASEGSSEDAAASSSTLRIQFKVFRTSSFTQEGITELHDRMAGTASARRRSIIRRNNGQQRKKNQAQRQSPMAAALSCFHASTPNR